VDVFIAETHALLASLPKGVAPIAVLRNARKYEKKTDRRAPMPDHDVQSEAAEAIFRRKFRQTLAARGYAGAELDRKVEELMNAPVRFRLDLNEDPSARDMRKS
jgi:hypothetical protein